MMGNTATQGKKQYFCDWILVGELCESVNPALLDQRETGTAPPAHQLPASKTELHCREETPGAARFAATVLHHINCYHKAPSVICLSLNRGNVNTFKRGAKSSNDALCTKVIAGGSREEKLNSERAWSPATRARCGDSCSASPRSSLSHIVTS